jgi:hypothetical protein
VQTIETLIVVASNQLNAHPGYLLLLDGDRKAGLLCVREQPSDVLVEVRAEGIDVGFKFSPATNAICSGVNDRSAELSGLR